jgi:UDP-3-O-[3-hydroxymyristoyl] glucosamine N-acyltransferase
MEYLLGVDGVRKGLFCDTAADPLYTEFVNGRRVLVKATHLPTFGRGVELGSGVIVNMGVHHSTVIGDDVMIWHRSVIGHACRIGARSVVAVGCTISGEVTIGEDCYIGSGSVIQPRCNIGDRVMLGSGSNVAHDTVIPDGEVWFGNPAKFQRVNEWRAPR